MPRRVCSKHFSHCWRSSFASLRFLVSPTPGILPTTSRYLSIGGRGAHPLGLRRACDESGTERFRSFSRRGARRAFSRHRDVDRRRLVGVVEDRVRAQAVERELERPAWRSFAYRRRMSNDHPVVWSEYSLVASGVDPGQEVLVLLVAGRAGDRQRLRLARDRLDLARRDRSAPRAPRGEARGRARVASSSSASSPACSAILKPNERSLGTRASSPSSVASATSSGVSKTSVSSSGW